MAVAGRSETTTEKGPGLARGPALIIGAILAAAGLLFFLNAGDTPTSGFPDGDAARTDTFLGFGINGWTAWFTTCAGALLLFGAAQHLLAKTMSLLVGLALAASAVIALIDGHDVLGLAYANIWVKLGWGIAAVLLLINTLLPRTRSKQREDTYVERPAGRDRRVEEDRVDRDEAVERDRVAGSGVAASAPSTAAERAASERSQPTDRQVSPEDERRIADQRRIEDERAAEGERPVRDEPRP